METRIIKVTGDTHKTPVEERKQAWNLTRVQAIQRVSGDQGTQPTRSCHRVMKDDTVYGKLLLSTAIVLRKYSSSHQDIKRSSEPQLMLIIIFQKILMHVGKHMDIVWVLSMPSHYRVHNKCCKVKMMLDQINM